MTHANSTITPVAKTTFKVGTYNALSDVFTSAVDLNDRASFWVVSVDMPQPKKVYSRSSTIRVPGERIAAWNYQNRHIKVTLQLLYGANPTALLASAQTLLAAIENPPYRLAFAAPNTSILTYADVVAVSHTIPYDGKLILNGAVKKIVLDFECLPGLPGDRLTLSNLVMNPGFEAPSGPSVYVFNDVFANTDAYSVLTGSAPAVASNVMSIPASSAVQFGSPAWGAINTWQIRFKWATNANPAFYLHYTNGSNLLQVFVFGTGFEIDHIIGGTTHQLALTSGMTALTAGTFYWLKVTQFPALPGVAPAVQATLYNDSAGAIGAAVTNGSLGPVLTFDAVTALSGKMGIAVGTGGMSVGGAFSNVNAVQLFGPGGWFNSNFGAGTASGAWDQNTANTYGGGPATSYGAARIDAPPTGALNSFWYGYVGGLPSAGAITGIPVAAPGDVLNVSVWAKGSGLGSASASVILGVGEYDSSGNFLRQGTVTSKTGAQVNGAWTQLSGTYTTGASCVYAQFQAGVTDSGNGSANGTVWFDNAQCWDQTTVQAATGQTSMPYCELRFPQSPAQLLVSGIAGELVADANLFMGVLETASSYTWWLGSQATPQPAAQLCLLGAVSSALFGATMFPVLSGVNYGGYYNTETSGTGAASVALEALGANATEKSLTGSFHVFGHLKIGDTHYSNQFAYSTAYETLSPTLPTLLMGSVATAQTPFGASTANWWWVDTGVLTLPIAPPLSVEDPAQKWVVWILNGVNNAGTPNGHWSWEALALLPADGDLVSAKLNTSNTVGKWYWAYNTPATVYTPSPGWRFNEAATALPNAAAAVGTLTSGAQGAITALGASNLRLDPTQKTGNDGSAIAVMAALLNDPTNGVNSGMVYELSYTPQYLFPRAS